MIIGWRGAGTGCEPKGAVTLDAKEGGLEDRWNRLFEGGIMEGEGKLQGSSEVYNE